MPDQQITVNLEPLYARLVRRTVLPFTPPLSERSLNPSRFQNEWLLLQGVFEFPDPAAVPSLELDSDDQVPLARFIDTCEELARYRIWASPVNYEINFSTGMTYSLPPREEIQAALTQFRHLFSNDEGASFRVVSSIIQKCASSATDAEAETRRELLNRWQRAHGQLRAYSLERLADRKVADELGQVPPEPIFGQDVSPEQLISEYAYGDFIHWGKKRDALASFSSKPIIAQMREVAFLSALAQLSHFYFGYSLVCQRFITDHRPGPVPRSGHVA